MRPAARRLCAAMIALLAAGAGHPAAAGAGEPVRLTVAFTGDVIGYLEPCG